MRRNARSFLVRLLSAREGLIGQPGALLVLRLGQTHPFTIEHQFGVIDQRHALLGGEVLRIAADEVDMRALLEHETRGMDGIAQPLDAGHAAGAHGARHAAIHQQRVELDFAVARKKGAPAGIEGLVVLKHSDRGLDCIDRGGAALQQRIAGEQCAADAEGVGFDGVIGDGPRAAMNEKDRLIGHANRSSYMAELAARSCYARGALGAEMRSCSAPLLTDAVLETGPGLAAGRIGTACATPVGASSVSVLAMV